MASLTSILPQLAPTLRLTTAALYERQRALVRMKLLPTPQGRGRGSGAEATPQTVALLLISSLATDALSEAAGIVGELAHAPYVVPRRKREATHCPFTGGATFAEALASVLQEGRTAKLNPSIEVWRDEPIGAVIYFHRRLARVADASYFGAYHQPISDQIVRKAELSFRAVAKIREQIIEAGSRSERAAG